MEQNSSSKILGKICGYFFQNTPIFRTTKNTATVEFVTDEYLNSEGFQALISFKTGQHIWFIKIFTLNVETLLLFIFIIRKEI